MGKRVIDEREQSIHAEMGKCAHFRGIQHERCLADVHLRELVGGPDFGWAARIPCLSMDAERCEVICDRRKLPTREEAEMAVDEDEQRFARFVIAHSAAKAHAKQSGLKQGNGGRGELPCPTDCGGTLRYSVAAVNGHMHAACSTKGCVQWME